MNPEIQKHLKKQSLKHYAFSNFIFVGTTFVLGKLIFASSLPTTLTSPIGLAGGLFLGYMSSWSISAYFNYKLLFDKKKETPFYNLAKSNWDRFYESSSSKFLTNYLNSSENLLEKKYKLIFLHIYLQSRYTDLPNFLSKDNTIISELSDELIKNKESKYDLKQLFEESSEISILDILKEDWNDDNKRNMIQKIYKEYESSGVLGHYFQYPINDKFQSLLLLQNNKINKSDISFINKLIKNNDTIHFDNGTINKLLKFQDGDDELSCLVNVFKNLDNVSSAYLKESGFDKDDLANQLDAKKRYLDLDGKLTVKNEVKKINKMKI